MASKVTKSKGNVDRSNSGSKPISTIFGLPLSRGGRGLQQGSKKAGDGMKGQVLICGESTGFDDLAGKLTGVPNWQLERLRSEMVELQCLAAPDGPVWVVWPHRLCSNKGDLPKEVYAASRQLVGQAAAEARQLGLASCEIVSLDAGSKIELGAVVGYTLAEYRFRNFWPNADKGSTLNASWQGFADELLEEGRIIGESVNLARHLVNLPAGVLHPVSFANIVQELHGLSSQISVDVWDEKKLAKERMNLLLAVGGAAEHPPRLVRIRYRPDTPSKTKPVALIGKGITFDTGGLDLKPPAGMRLMKKDMGGAAALVGLSHYISWRQPKQGIDIYLALAENSVDARSFRPGDVIASRAGKTVEIHNTDAEGRLVLADAIDVARSETGANQPGALVDIATLTGAIKVGLGAEVAGLFANEPELCSRLQVASVTSGEPLWPMPLFQNYLAMLKSEVADFSNAASSGLGGAITAALFLHQFAGDDVPWAHMDIYAWQDQPGGGIIEPGGSGQGVQLLIDAFAKGG